MVSLRGTVSFVIWVGKGAESVRVLRVSELGHVVMLGTRASINDGEYS